jgi:uncharacterized membrane protein YkvA (DUF1232 family)
MKSFDQILQEEIEDYEGQHDHLISFSPALYRILVSLMDDPRLPGRLRPMISAAITYFVLPADVISVESHGPVGFTDDIFLSAFILERVRGALGRKILEDNWDGRTPLLPLIVEILDHENRLIGNQRDRILTYIGWEFIPKRV